MPGWFSRWTESLRAVGAAAVGLLQAELDALLGDLRDTGAGLGKALAWLACGMVLAVVALLAAAVAAFEGLVLLVPRWAAALIVLGVAILLAAGSALVGRSTLRRLESPATTVRRRATDHLDWWRDTLADGRLQGPDEDPEDGG